MKHKIMGVMARARARSSSRAGWRWMTPISAAGAPAASKTPFVAAVSTGPEGRPRKLKLAPVRGFRKREIARGAEHWLAPGSTVVTDGLGCWGVLGEGTYNHRSVRTGSGPKAARVASFKWVNTTLGNIKSAITGTYRKLGPDHAERYLASFAWRYNRRYHLKTMITRFVHSAARTNPCPNVLPDSFGFRGLRADRMRVLLFFSVLLLFIGVLAGAGVLYGFYYFGRGLPDYQQLADYEPPVVTRMHAGDGRLLAEFAVENRIFVPASAMPLRIKNAFLAAEDKNFYEHPGVDIVSIARAVANNFMNRGTNRRPQGGSTITQQVAKNFLLSSEVSIDRKAKEAILALRMERVLSKDRILELYLNEIYLGFGSYGVASAAINYFNESLDNLTLAQAAYLAALPKAPNNYNPIRNYDAAKSRRDWVIDRMVENGFIAPSITAAAKAEPLIVQRRDPTEFVRADYFTEEVRRHVMRMYGENGLYRGGLSVRTTLDPRLQAVAKQSLVEGLIAYDRRHGWRGPVSNIVSDPASSTNDWAGRIAKSALVGAPPTWKLALVTDLIDDVAHLSMADGSEGVIALADLAWARSWRPNQRLGPKVKRCSDVLATGDVVVVEPLPPEDGESPETTRFGLRQIPDVGGALVALDPHNGRVLAMVGGIGFDQSQFNRATQAWRQPGSAFKPFVYIAALDNGFTPASLIDDAPIVIDQGPGLPKWKPANYTTRFYGPSTLRLGVEKSRNLMTVRLARAVGMDQVAAYAEELGVVDSLPRQLSMALGAGETTLMRLTTAYATIVNGGKRVTPTLIERIQDRHGKTIFRRDERACDGCRVSGWLDLRQPVIDDTREQVLDPATAYQMVTMLTGVVQRGTGVKIRELAKPLAGKTGTTNDFMDTWFIGFSPDLAVGVFVGFDQPRTLGPKESGSKVAVPIFKEFMRRALSDTPAIPFRVPAGIENVRIDADSGLLPSSATDRIILEAFRPGTVPVRATPLSEARPTDLY